MQSRTSRSRLAASVACAAVLSLSASGCELLGGSLGFTPPTLGLQSATLVQYPGVSTLAAYYCPDVLGGGLTGVACSVFGARPPVQALNFFFDLDFDAGNNGAIPIPIVEALVGLNLFPGAAQQSLGTACVTFCEPGDPSCDGSSGPGACANPSPAPTGGWDLAAGVAGMLFGVADGGLNNLRIRTIPPGERINLRMTFGIDPVRMLSTLSGLSSQVVNSLLGGQGFALDVPYSVRGNLFYDVPSFGRFDLPFGPFDDEWKITD